MVRDRAPAHVDLAGKVALTLGAAGLGLVLAACAATSTPADGASDAVPEAVADPAGLDAVSEPNSDTAAPSDAVDVEDAAPEIEPPSVVAGTNGYGPDGAPTPFAPVADGGTMPIILGEQGLYMVIIAGQTSGITGPVVVDAELRYDNHHVASADDEVRELEPLVGAAAGAIGFRDVFLVFEGFPFTGLPMELKVQVVGTGGEQAKVKQAVILQ